MSKPLLLFLALLLPACAVTARSTEVEERFLGQVIQEISALRGQFRELEEFNPERIEQGPGWMSYVYDKTKAGPSPLFSRSYFWFKVSFAKDPVDAFQSHEPVLTMYIPEDKKYLKLRIVSDNLALVQALLRTVYEQGLRFDGEDPRILPYAARSH